jgi:hypothetical protein
MATHRLSIFGQLSPDETGRAFHEPYSVKATNDVWHHLVAVFNDPAGGQVHGFYGTFNVPKNYVGTASLKIVWTSTATTGNCRWRFTYRAVGGDDSESLDQTSNQEQVSVTDAAPGAANRRMEASVNLTSANLAADDTVEFLIERNDDSGTDTMAAAATMHDLLIEYADA